MNTLTRSSDWIFNPMRSTGLKGIYIMHLHKKLVRFCIIDSMSYTGKVYNTCIYDNKINVSNSVHDATVCSKRWRESIRYPQVPHPLKAAFIWFAPKDTATSYKYVKEGIRRSGSQDFRQLHLLSFKSSVFRIHSSRFFTMMRMA